MSEHWSTQDRLLIVQGLAVLDQWRDSDDETAEPTVELQRQIGVKQGYERASLFRRQIRM